MPILDEFCPQMIFIPAGFEGHREDSMAEFVMVDDCLSLSGTIMSIASRHAGGHFSVMARFCIKNFRSNALLTYSLTDEGLEGVFKFSGRIPGPKRFARNFMGRITDAPRAPSGRKGVKMTSGDGSPVTASKRVFNWGNFQHLFWQQSANSGI